MDDIGKNRERGRWLAVEAGFCLVLILLALVVGLSRYRNGIDFWDEGLTAHGAERVLVGEIPHRDFVSPRPPLSFYTVAVFFRFFGMSLLTMRIFGLCLYVAMPVLIYVLARMLAGRVMSFAASLPVLAIGITTGTFAPYPSYQGLVATLTAVILLLRAVDTDRAGWAILAGIVSALVFLLRQDQGGYLAVAVFAYVPALWLAKRQNPFPIRPFRLLLFWLVGLAAVLLPLLFYWYKTGAIPAMYEQLVLFPLTVYRNAYAYPMPALDFSQPLESNLLATSFYLAPVVCGFILLWLLVTLRRRRRFNNYHARLAFFVVLTLCFYSYVLVRSDIYHLVITAPPFFILFGWLLQVISNRVQIIIGKIFFLRQRAGWLSFISPAVVLLASGLLGTWYLYCTRDTYLCRMKSPNRPLALKRGGIYVPDSLADWIENSVARIHKHSEPNQAILCLPYHPLFYFLAERRNPTSWSFIYPGDPPPDKYPQFIRQLEMDPPAVIMTITYEDQMRDYAPTITSYISRKYQLIDIVDDCAFLLPKNVKKH